jgi:phosphoribosylanthranilate isomerase
MAESKRSGAKRTRIKICGITRPEDARDAADAGADAIGLVFYAASRRAIEPAAAVEVCAALPPLVSVVALFVDPDRGRGGAVLAVCALDLLQFHGSESDAFCAQFQPTLYQGGSMRPDVRRRGRVAEHSAARALLFDAWREDARRHGRYV